DIETRIGDFRVVGAAHGRCDAVAAVTSGAGKANPVIAMRRCAGGVAQCLVGRAVMHNDVAFVVHGVGLMGPHDWQLARRTGIAAIALRTGRAGNAGLATRTGFAHASWTGITLVAVLAGPAGNTGLTAWTGCALVTLLAARPGRAFVTA